MQDDDPPHSRGEMCSRQGGRFWAVFPKPNWQFSRTLSFSGSFSPTRSLFRSSLCTNQLLCRRVYKCLPCNLMKANSHKDGKLLPGNSTPQRLLYFLTSPQNKSSFMLTRSPRAHCQGNHRQKPGRLKRAIEAGKGGGRSDRSEK